MKCPAYFALLALAYSFPPTSNSDIIRLRSRLQDLSTMKKDVYVRINPWGESTSASELVHLWEMFKKGEPGEIGSYASGD